MLDINFMNCLKGEAIRNISEYINLINKFSSEISNSSIGRLWFRAENVLHASTQLIPTFYREFANKEGQFFLEINENIGFSLRIIEERMKAEFRTSGSSYNILNKYLGNDWETYYLMQHYGISTRLLDWSESALISLFFCVESELQKDGVVWLLNPVELNRYSELTDNLINNEAQFIYTPHVEELQHIEVNKELNKYLNLDVKKKYPVAIIPNRFDQRMKVQKSCFTIFGNEINGMISNPFREKYLRKIIINKENIKEIKEELFWLGITYENLYPGPDSVGKDVMYKVKNLLK